MRFVFPLVIFLLTLFSFGCASSGCSDGDDDTDEDDTPMVAPSDPTPVRWGAEEEPNDGPDDANVIGLGMTIDGELTLYNLDYYSFELGSDFQGYKVTVSVTDDAGDCFEGVDPYVRILDQDGETSLYWLEDSIEDYCPVLSFVPIRQRTYYVEVGTNFSVLGSYSISLEDGGPGTVAGTVSVSSAARVAGGLPSDREGPRALLTGDDFGLRTGIGVGSQEIEIRPGELLLEPSPFVDRTTLVSRLRVDLGIEVRRVRPLLGGRFQFVRWALEPSTGAAAPRSETLRLVERARSLPWVLRAEPNHVFRPVQVPGDSLYGEQWNLGSDPGINLEPAWDLTTGEADIVVAVIDTGDDAGHSELEGKSVLGFDFISDAGNAGDGDGVDSDPDDNLRQGHGIHVTGIIAAATDNASGIAGVGWDVSYMPLRVCGNFGCTFADVIEAIGYAAGLESAGGPGQEAPRADVINISLGGGDSCPGMLQDVVSAAAYRGVVLVAAAGNEGVDAGLFTPGNCLQVFAVGATDDRGEVAGFSNFGDTVDVLAPGVDILSLAYGNDYVEKSGTSMAAPHISGLVGLVKAIDIAFWFEPMSDLIVGACTVPGCSAEIADATVILQAALDASGSIVAPPDLVLVQAVDISDPDHFFYTFARDGEFRVEGLEPGSYLIQAGVDIDGDFVLGETGEMFGRSDVAVEVSSSGEDHASVGVVLE